jgi:hypothetical protein
MILTCTRYSKWANGKEFNKDDDVEVGVDVTDKMAEDMLRCGYAVVKKAKPIIETKKPDNKEEAHEEKKDSFRKGKKRR